MSDKYKIPTSQKEIQEIITDKVIDSMRKRGLKVYTIIGWSELLGQPFILQNSTGMEDLARMSSLYPVAIIDCLREIEESDMHQSAEWAIASAEFVIQKLDEWLKPRTCHCGEESE